MERNGAFRDVKEGLGGRGVTISRGISAMRNTERFSCGGNAAVSDEAFRKKLVLKAERLT